LKRLSNDLQPYHEAVQIIQEILATSENIRIMDHLLSYAQLQFGDRIPGKVYRQRGNSERIDNFEVEIFILIHIYSSSINIYTADTSLGITDRDNLKLPLVEKTLEILKPWSSCLDLDTAAQIDGLRRNNVGYFSMVSNIDYILELLTICEDHAASIYMHRNRIEISENHCQRAITYARQYNEEGETKTNLLLKTLSTYSLHLSNRGEFAGAISVAEEAYNCAAIAYNPVHPKVQKAAGTLIECLIRKGDLDNAELFSQMTLDSLKDPANKVDQEGEEVARGYFNLANVISMEKSPKKDYKRAEMLVRESLRIRTKLYSNDHWHIGSNIGLLASILRKQFQFGPELQALYERTLAIDKKHHGPDGINVSVSYTNLGQYLYIFIYVYISIYLHIYIYIYTYINICLCI
jgi:tetratricopeptide (TPR) repeat protein